jgi:hypothetical protein
MRRLTERASLREDAAGLLGELGGTASEVAATLCSVGLHDRTSSASQCAVARYLHAVMGPDSRVKRAHVRKNWLVVTTTERWRPGIWLRLPPPVREFMASPGAAGPPEGTEDPPPASDDRRAATPG